MHSGIPVRHKHAIDTITPEGPWGDMLTNLTDGLGVGFLTGVIGKRGTGKTQLAAFLAREATLGRGMTVCYITAADLFAVFKRSYNASRGEHTESDLMKMYGRFDLLIIDEMHERGNSEWEDQILTRLLDKRYGAVKDTLLISNLEAEAFVKSIGPSIASRMRETGGLMKCEWASYRGTA